MTEKGKFLLDLGEEDFCEQGEFTPSQFNYLLEWTNQRKLYHLKARVKGIREGDGKPIELEGKVLKTQEFNFYTRSLLILSECLTMGGETMDVPFFLEVRKSRLKIYFERMFQKEKKELNPKNVYFSIKKLEESFKIKEFIIINEFVEDEGHEVYFRGEDLEDSLEWLEIKAKRYEIQGIFDGTLNGEKFLLRGKLDQLKGRSFRVRIKELFKVSLFGEENTPGKTKDLTIELSSGDDAFNPKLMYFSLKESKEKLKEVIKVKNLSVSFGDNEVIKDASFQVSRGEIIGIVGESGSGKSTTIKAMLGELDYQGEIQILGINARNPKKIAPFVGYVPQDLSLMYEDFTPMENIIHFGRQYGLDEEFITRKAKKILNDLNILEVMDKPVSSLSGGQKRRVSVAISLIQDPEILILDEPTSGLDPMTRFELWKYFDRINKSYDIVLLVISHYLDEIEYSDKSAVYFNGVGMYDFDTPENLKASLPGGGKCLEITLEDIELEAIDIMKEVKGVAKVVQRGERIRILSDDFEPELKKRILKILEDDGIKVFDTEEDVIVDMIDYFSINSRQIGQGKTLKQSRKGVNYDHQPRRTEGGKLT